MQVCTVSVNLGGKADHQVIGKVVTVPEIQILQAIHGATSVTSIVPVSEVNRSQNEEIERLKQLYGEPAFAKVYAGQFPRLPLRLQDIGMDLEEQAKALRTQAEKLMADAAKIDAAKEGKIVADPLVRAPKTLNELFGDDDEPQKAAA